MISVLLLIFAVSCSAKKTQQNEGPELVEEVSQEVSAAEGGKIEAESKDEEVSIDIPAGALDEDVTITMKIYDAKGYPGTDGLDVISKVVEFEPTGTIFKKPVTITMKSLENVGGSARKDGKAKVVTAAVYRESEKKWSYSETGAAVKIAGYEAGGDPIMQTAAGDPIMLNAAGDPIMMSAGGDPIMLSAAGDPIMVTAAGDPIMQTAAGDPIMMTTGHFTAYAFLVAELKDGEAIENPDGDSSSDDNDNDNGISDDDDDIDISDNEIPDEEVIDDDPDTAPEGPDPCESDPCADIAHSDGVCSTAEKDGAKVYACGCVDPYAWDGEGCSSVCAGNPCASVPHSTGICKPLSATEYSCGCASGAFWSGSECLDPCAGDPCASVQYSTGCVPKSANEYVCACEDVYSWDGSKCKSPCDGDPCAAFADTNGVCTVQGKDFCACGCNDGLYWWGTVKGCTEEQPAFGRICTSQFKCYDNYDEIECPEPGEPFYGQDANKAREGVCAPKSFTIVETGIENEDIVYDNNTGLEWMRTLDGSIDCRWEDAYSYCEDLSYGGYEDWRLPTPKEYLTIVHNNRWPTLDTNYFDLPGPDSDGYYDYRSWTSYSAPYGNYWGVDFSSGALTDFGNNPTNFVRCVRGDEMPESEFIIPEEYEEADEKVVVDIVSGLQWQYHDADIPDDGDFWKGGMEYCENLEYAGYSDWRLPNKDELMTIVDFGSSDPASSFPDIEAVSYLLTSTTMPNTSSYVFRLYLPRGSMNMIMDKTTDYLNSIQLHAHCVRSE